ncbi:hypothetical protein A4H97_08375 [Niastella yeongjuensis]|uniref:DUF885 domain-containing protein n=1 Tax=Niastella yeongjuensis TaxID=354355 RepID=A0A1V9EMY9_9BACT|nr:DUF885 domain-containing protein [Niastella yeongjuensis]OQP47496.1 hypothetical protein A4H97_08375 [Niastella yeongjuensis]SEN86794.1 Uncharacterized conserved protein, DUF885 familyt [Niastella yeongjuensis]
MNKLFTVLLITGALAACKNKVAPTAPEAGNKELATLFEKYYNGRMALLPVEATINGDTLYNDQLPAEFTDSYRDKLSAFFTGNLQAVQQFNREQLNETDRTSFDIFKREMEMSIEGLKYQYLSTIDYSIDGHVPFNQFYGLPLSFGQMGSGAGAQPFNTVRDYDNWLKRAAAFPAWADSAIVYFQKGITVGNVLPAKLVEKMITQMQNMVATDVTQSLYYGPVKSMPASFPEADKKRLTAAFTPLITNTLSPAFQKLADFLKKEYLPKARTSTGIKAVPDGPALYDYLVRYWTTTPKTPDEIYNTGLAEVKRIRGLMDSVKNSVGFKGDLKAFFEYMRTDKKFKPYKTPEEVLNAFRNIQARIEPHLKDMFGHIPKMKFEIRQTEAFRAASASAEYKQGTVDGKRPGIFYVPILDATAFNTTSGMESLFLHEAIPGHHYQVSLTLENTALPTFRRYLWYGAYGEGWALYCESLGKELGLYTDPYQYAGALGDEMHRAIRLVVDVAMHAKDMTREQAIAYMMENEAISEEGATAEIERYMALPAQALSYKIGALKIRELRNKYSQEQGAKFSLSAFHDEFLHFGCMPLELVEKNMDEWAADRK